MTAAGQRVSQILEEWRSQGLVNPPNDQLLAIYEYLLQGEPTSPSTRAPRPHHWFCSQANETTRHAAISLLRLAVYPATPLRATWVSRLTEVMINCCECADGLEGAKERLASSYFHTLDPPSVAHAYSSLDALHLQGVLDSAQSSGNISNLPGLFYQLVTHWHVFESPVVLQLILNNIPTSPFYIWPSNHVPPGLFVLFLHENAQLRTWAFQQSGRCSCKPMALDFINPTHRKVLQTLVHGIERHQNLPDSQLPNTSPHPSLPLFGHYTFSSDLIVSWAALYAALLWLPPECVTKDSPKSIDIKPLVFSHLSDNGQHFSGVLECFMVLLKRLVAQCWDKKGTDYPLVAFSAVKDNPAYLEMLRQGPVKGKERWYLDWFRLFLESIHDLPIFAESLPQMVSFICQELQHVRFGDERPNFMASCTELLRTIQLRETPDRKALANTLAIHAEVLVSVAFGLAYVDQKWKTARASARIFVKSVLTKDIKMLAESVEKLAKYIKAVRAKDEGRKYNAADLDFAQGNVIFRVEIWKASFSSLRDFHAVALVLQVLAEISLVSPLTKKAFLPSNSPVPILTLFNTVNSFIETISTECDLGISAYTTYDLTISGIFTEQPDLIRTATLLLLSPLQQLSDASQRLIGLAFDVDERDACFRALLKQDAVRCMSGLITFLGKFTPYSGLLPEACALTQSLVRCFSDVIDVLCGVPGGLLRDSSFLQLDNPKGVHTLLPSLWKSMVKCTSAICQFAPLWSKYVDVRQMVFWMRDALIFGRDLLAHRPEIEAAVQQSDKKQAKEMVEELVELIPALSQWLRLTDEELLHQSFSLLQSLLETLRDSGIKPTEEGFNKLQNRIKAAKSADPSRSRLDPYRVKQLEAALLWFSDEEDAEIIGAVEAPDHDLEVMGHKHAPPIPEPGPSVAQKAKDVKPVAGLPKDANLKPTPKDPPNLTLKPTHKSTMKAAPRRSVKKVEEWFTEADQARLDSAGSMPKFKRTAPKIAVVGPSQAGRSMPRTSVSSAASSSKSLSESSDGDSEESEEDEEEGGLKALAAKQAPPRKPSHVPKKTVERRGVQLLPYSELSGRKLATIPKVLKVQPAEPNYNLLHKAILSWRYDHSGPSPPIRSGRPPMLHPVPSTFRDLQHYWDVFRPLLLQECWGQLSQSKDEQLDEFPVQITGRSYSDTYAVFDGLIQTSVTRDWYLSETDIIVLRSPKSNASVMGKVASFQSAPTQLQVAFKCMNDVGSGLEVNSTYLLKKVFSLSTLHREFAALESVDYYELRNAILQGSVDPRPSPDTKRCQELQKRHQLNEPQAEAIAAALAMRKFVLIQGPPGTGKTSTICGLVSAALARNKEGPSKLLICAPSNAAIDEVCHRLDGVLGRGKVVRVGADSSVNQSVQDITLNALVDSGLNNQGGTRSADDATTKLTELRNRMEALKADDQKVMAELNALHDNLTRRQFLSDEHKRLVDAKNKLASQIEAAKTARKNAVRTLDATRRQESAKVLKNADVVCGTLSGSGHPVIANLEFDTVIIDEAAQAIELSSLIPLKFNAARYILVGDPQQLAPTVISGKASECKYNQSLFVRLQGRNPDAAHLLSIQYRMHPEISRLPSNLFYGGRLTDGPEMSQKTQKPWHSNPRFGVYRFFNVNTGSEEQSGHSVKNSTEVNSAVLLYERLRNEYPKYDFDFKIGIITMYRGQLNELKSAFVKRFGRSVRQTIDFNTVDGFQGQEKEIIILSCVRAGTSSTNIGFLADVRRMNVALTRAKSSLFILGHASTLSRSNDVWNKIVGDARDRKLMVDNFTPSWFRGKDPVAVSIASDSSPPKKKARLSVQSDPDVNAPPNLVALGGHKRTSSGTSRSLTKAPLSSLSGASATTSSPTIQTPGPDSTASTGAPEFGVARERPLHEGERSGAIASQPPLQGSSNGDYPSTSGSANTAAGAPQSGLNAKTLKRKVDQKDVMFITKKKKKAKTG